MSVSVQAKWLQLYLTLSTPWAVACQAPLSPGFSRQQYCSGLLCPPPGNLPYSRIKPVSLRAPSLAGGFFTWEAHIFVYLINESVGGSNQATDQGF